MELGPRTPSTSIATRSARRGPGRAIASVIGAALLTVTACGGAPAQAGPPPAATAARRYATAASSGQDADVRAMLSSRLQARYDDRAVASLLAENRSENRDLAAELRGASAGRLVENARVRLTSGENVVLVREAGGWRVDSGVADRPALAGPMDAVQELRLALERGTLQALLRVLARDTRAAVADEIRDLVEATSEEGALEVEVTGDSATVRTPGGRRIVLAREGGEWRVVDVE